MFYLVEFLQTWDPVSIMFCVTTCGMIVACQRGSVCKCVVLDHNCQLCVLHNYGNSVCSQ